MKTLLYANRAEPKSISVISILLLAAVGDITKLCCMHREHVVCIVLYLCFAKSLVMLYICLTALVYSLCFDCLIKRNLNAKVLYHFE